MNVIRKIMILCLLVEMVVPVWAKDYQMTMFGIKSDGTTMNTRSIQKAIDFISENGGGRLVFTVGRYLTGSIHLKSNVTIHLGEGAVLVGSTNPYDYDIDVYKRQAHNTDRIQDHRNFIFRSCCRRDFHGLFPILTHGS